MSKFRIAECSDLDYDSLVVDISNENRRIATLNCENGIDNTDVAVFDSKTRAESLSENYGDQIEVLSSAFERSKKVNNINKDIYTNANFFSQPTFPNNSRNLGLGSFIKRGYEKAF